jgi:hypothetical protein
MAHQSLARGVLLMLPLTTTTKGPPFMPGQHNHEERSDGAIAKQRRAMARLPSSPPLPPPPPVPVLHSLCEPRLASKSIALLIRIKHRPLFLVLI